MPPSLLPNSPLGKATARRSKKGPPSDETGQEAAYLRFLSEKQVQVTVKLRDGESVGGWIEYFDESMIRLTRQGRPNLFIYKHQIRTITEQPRRTGNEDESRRRAVKGEGPRKAEVQGKTEEEEGHAR